MNVHAGTCVYVMLSLSYPLLARKPHVDTCRKASKGTSFMRLKTNLNYSVGSAPPRFVPLINSFIWAAYFYFTYLKESYFLHPYYYFLSHLLSQLI